MVRVDCKLCDDVSKRARAYLSWAHRWLPPTTAIPIAQHSLGRRLGSPMGCTVTTSTWPRSGSLASAAWRVIIFS
eukprot:2495793-Amphidinium_carterae.1